MNELYLQKLLGVSENHEVHEEIILHNCIKSVLLILIVMFAFNVILKCRLKHRIAKQILLHVLKWPLVKE